MHETSGAVMGRRAASKRKNRGCERRITGERHF
jgi:hypothetical protein